MELTQIILLILLFLFTVIFITWQVIKRGYREVVIDLIVSAEKELKDNQEKFNMVVNNVIGRFPFPFNLIPISLVEGFVQRIFDEIKIALDYQKTDC